jgi:filamentous hemagglutinin family protein
MNRIFRLVWNFSLGCYVVAPETARSKSKSSACAPTKSLLIALLSGAASATSTMIFAADLIPIDATTSVNQALNGVPVVDIKNPNAAGLSHNKYSQYNVGSEGLVLNNNAGNQALQSQLAGQVFVNLNLDKAATVILNEVVAANRSTLAGYTEVVGSKADVVVANPWGITCSGCGFINVDRVSLTTGTPNINGGMLTGFNVQQGSVIINGSGADLSTQQMFDVVARQINVQGQINANDLKLVAGSNEWNYGQRTASAIAGEDVLAKYSIDSSMLGGMYAGKIQLISTEVGVGVRTLADAAATADDFSITADGRIEVRSRLSAKQDLTLTSSHSGDTAISLVDATLSAQRDVILNARVGEANVQGGFITAGRNLGVDANTLSDSATAATEGDSNKRYAGENVALTVANQMQLRDVTYGAGNELVATTGSLTLNGDNTTLYTQASRLNLSAAANMKLNKAAIISAAGISLRSDVGVISTAQGPGQAVQAESGDILMTAATGVNNAGTIGADKGALVISADGAIDNQGELFAKQSLVLQDKTAGATENVSNSGNILSDGTLTITSSQLTNTGGIQGSGETAISATDLTNNGLIIAANSASQVGTINASSLSNSGTIQSAAKLDMTVDNRLTNLADGLILAKVLEMELGTFSNSGTVQSQTGASAIDITGDETFTNTGTGKILLAMADTSVVEGNGGTLDFGSKFINNGVLHSNSDLALIAENITNNAGISALGKLEIGTAGKLSDVVNLTNKNTLYAGKNLKLSAVTINNDGSLKSGSLIDIDSLVFLNSREVDAKGDINIDTFLFTNRWDNEKYGPEVDEYTTYEVYGKTRTDASDLSDYTNTVTLGGFTFSVLKKGNSYTKIEDCFAGACDENQVNVYEEKVITEQRLSDANWVPNADSIAQILAAGNITINTSIGTNSGAAVIFASGVDDLNDPKGNLTVTSDSFTNPAFKLTSSTAKKRFAVIDDNGTFSDDETEYYYAKTDEQWENRPKLNKDDNVSMPVSWEKTTSFERAQSRAVPLKPVNGSGIDVTRAILGANGTFSVKGGEFTNESSTSTTSSEPVNLNIDPASNSDALSLTGVNITLPTNPFGYFVPNEEPNSKYLVETNPLFAVGSQSVGSDFLAQRFGYDPDEELRRLGDSNYELYLIRQQLIAQTGSNILAGYANETAVVQSLMEQGADEALRLGMQWGVAPTAEQLADLTEDMVWMVEVEVAGQKVIAPRVFLSAATRNSIVTGAVITASNIAMDVDSFTNTGGTVTASGLLDIKSQQDITNTSGTMRGGDVVLTSTEGSVINQTAVEGAGDDSSYITEIGRTASIEATNSLAIEAEQDIQIIGADVTAGGAALLDAGGDIIVDTVVDKTTTTNAGVNTADGMTTTTTGSEINRGSTLNIGENLTTSSGGDTVIAGSDVTVIGELDTEAGGDFKVIARQDRNTSQTVSERSGSDVGEGLYGTETVTTDTFTGTNSGSTLNVGGNARVEAQGEFVQQGSDINVVGEGDIYGKEGISILDGLDEERTTVVTETTSFMKTDGDSASGSGSGSGSGSSQISRAGSASAEANANASANAENESNIKLTETTTTTEDSGSRSSVASSLNIGGGLKLRSDAEVVIQGSKLNVVGSTLIDAESVDVLAGRNESWEETTVETTSIGIYSDSEAGAEAEAGAGADSSLAGLGSRTSADASAESSAETTLTIGGRSEYENEREDTVTNVMSTINTGGSLTIIAQDTVTFAGAEVESGGTTTINATDIKNIAVQDTYEKTSTSEQTTAGLYYGASASAESESEADASISGGGMGGGAKVEGQVEAGYRLQNETSGSVSGTVTNTGNSFKSGGGFERNATNTILDQATQVDAAGPITQSATTITDEAVQDRVYSSEESNSVEGRVGLYADVSGEANAEGSARVVGRKDADSETGSDAGAGLKGQFEMEDESASSETSTAVTSTFKSGSSITSTSSDKTSLEGTQFEAAEDIAITASELEYKAAEDSTTETGDSQNIALEVKAAVYGNVGAKGEGEYGNSDTVTSTTTARTGSAVAGGNLTITTTKGDATFEGTDLTGENSATIDAAGDVNFEAAKNTETSTSTEFEAEASVSATKGKSSGGAVGSGNQGFSGSVEGEYEDIDNETAVVGSITSGSGGTSISSGKTVVLVGTQLETTGTTTIDAEAVILNAAVSTTSETSIEAELEAGKQVEGGGLHKTGEVEGAAGGDVTRTDSVSSQVTRIQSGDGTSITGGVIINQEADLSSGTELNGFEIKIGAENSESGYGFGGKFESGTE